MRTGGRTRTALGLQLLRQDDRVQNCAQAATDTAWSATQPHARTLQRVHAFQGNSAASDAAAVAHAPWMTPFAAWMSARSNCAPLILMPPADVFGEAGATRRREPSNDATFAPGRSAAVGT
jgi:hypothetical protein